jgi:hypothetical protein
MRHEQTLGQNLNPDIRTTSRKLLSRNGRRVSRRFTLVSLLSPPGAHWQIVSGLSKSGLHERNSERLDDQRP